MEWEDDQRSCLGDVDKLDHLENLDVLSRNQRQAQGHFGGRPADRLSRA